MHTVLDEVGFMLIRGVASSREQQTLLVALGLVAGAGRRGIMVLPEVSALARSTRFIELIRPHLSGEPSPVRAIYFDKSPGSNWLVAWHQDLTIAVRKRVAAPGFSAWSVKDGITHVQPPVEVLQQMLTLRLHLDDADETNGALRVLPGTHALGRVPSERIQELRSIQPEFVCKAEAGDVLLMRPLLLHASGRSECTRHRRVLHIEYADFRLPEGLEWNETA
jgi:hypothetical protein